MNDDYVWINGVPHEKKKNLALQGKCPPRSYHIVSDPYRKRILIEKYFSHVFDSLVYDSALLDFRHLRTMDEGAWEREHRLRTPMREESWLRDPNGRLVLRENVFYQHKEPYRCELYSPHGIFLAWHAIYNKNLGYSWNGVIFFDRQNHPVFWKEYLLDAETNSFTDLIREEWDMSRSPPLFI